MAKTYIPGETKEQRKARKAIEKGGATKVVTQQPNTGDRRYILCLKHGQKYSADYVNKLYNMTQRHCTLEHEFVCITEDPAYLLPGIQTIPLPKGLDGWWNKPYMFSKDLPINGTILYLDLDVVITSFISTPVPLPTVIVSFFLEIFASWPTCSVTFPTAACEDRGAKKTSTPMIT